MGSEAASKSGGASQPAIALLPLKALDQTSAKFGTFAVRLCRGRILEFDCKSRHRKQRVPVYRFEAWLVGEKPSEYCIGYVKGSEAVCRKAKTDYMDDLLWTLSKISLDANTSSTNISTPIPFRIDLAKSVLTAMTGDGLCARMPTHPVPPRTVADVFYMTTKRSTDLIALLKGVSAYKRRSKADEEILDVELVDLSKTNADMLATIVVSVFGKKDKIQFLKDSVGEPMAFFNLTITCSGRGEKPRISHFGNEILMSAPECEKTSSLREAKKDLAGEIHAKGILKNALKRQRPEVAAAPMKRQWCPNTLLATESTAPDPVAAHAALEERHGGTSGGGERHGGTSGGAASATSHPRGRSLDEHLC